jgi:hypothetical protein
VPLQGKASTENFSAVLTSPALLFVALLFLQRIKLSATSEAMHLPCPFLSKRIKLKVNVILTGKQNT